MLGVLAAARNRVCIAQHSFYTLLRKHVTHCMKSMDSCVAHGALREVCECSCAWKQRCMQRRASHDAKGTKQCDNIELVLGSVQEERTGRGAMRNMIKGELGQRCRRPTAPGWAGQTGRCCRARSDCHLAVKDPVELNCRLGRLLFAHVLDLGQSPHFGGQGAHKLLRNSGGGVGADGW